MKENKNIVYKINNKRKKINIDLVKKIIEIKKVYKYPFINNGFIIDMNKIYLIINEKEKGYGIIFKNKDIVLIVDNIENRGKNVE